MQRWNIPLLPTFPDSKVSISNKRFWLFFFFFLVAGTVCHRPVNMVKMSNARSHFSRGLLDNSKNSEERKENRAVEADAAVTEKKKKKEHCCKDSSGMDTFHTGIKSTLTDIRADGDPRV